MSIPLGVCLFAGELLTIRAVSAAFYLQLSSLRRNLALRFEVSLSSTSSIGPITLPLELSIQVRSSDHDIELITLSCCGTVET